MTEELKCPVCKSDSYLNPNIKIYISPCFHKICEQCLYKIFAHGYAPCPECQTPLRRINFITSTFEDIEIEREIKTRKVAHRHFTRTFDEFGNEEDYNDYLEEFENLILELMDLRTEVAMKERINMIKSTENILNPISNEKTVSKDVKETVKKIKIEEPSWGVYNEAYKPRDILNIEYSIPLELIIPYEAGGLTKETILRYFLYSLDCSTQ